MARDVVAEIRRATRRKYRAEDKIRIVLDGLRAFSDERTVRIGNSNKDSQIKEQDGHRI